MKFRLFAMVLALSLVAWAQKNPSASTPNATPAPAKSCCHHAANASDAKGCCHRENGDAKDAAADCCSKDKCAMKDGKSCCEDSEMAASCCAGKDMKKCMKQCKKGGGCANGKCCGAAGEKAAMNCCGNKCERPEHVPSAS